jgi:transglutaminase-like putative cysteine protease
VTRLRIRHLTGFDYEGEATASYNEARMLPATGDGQLVLTSNLDISPVTSLHGYVDYWGTRVSSFEVLAPHERLTLTATSVVEVRRSAADERSLGWERLLAATAAATEYVEQLAQTPLTRPPDGLAELTRAIVARHDDPCSAAREVCIAIGERMQYLPGATGVHTTAAEAWERRAGVCQDITHLALGALRSAGIAARYVSGYLHPKAEPEVGVTVAGESHAWVEWFCGRWHGFDPTNLIDIGDRHVVVGRGRDYADVAPLRGVYAGPTHSRLSVTVEITREA